jgi:UDP-GlcNAc:undecaprenyl-phosphate GlcNAc-1-phosphate transferase
MMIGLLLAGATTSASGKINYTRFGGSDLIALLAPLLVVIAVLFLPMLDLVMAVIRRTRRGESPFAADKMHLHHRLLEIGHSHRRAVLIMWLWAGLIAFGGVLASLYASRLTAALLTVWIVVTVVLTFVVPRVQRPSLPG